MRYTAYFRLVKGDVFFGPRIWVDVHVVSNEEELVTETVSSSFPSFSPFFRQRMMSKLRSGWNALRSNNKSSVNLQLTHTEFLPDDHKREPSEKRPSIEDPEYFFIKILFYIWKAFGKTFFFTFRKNRQPLTIKRRNSQVLG